MKAGSIAGILGGLATAPLLVGLSAAPVWAASAAPPGNNGTIKVDGQAFDQGHDNEPHPGCTFRLTFFGFDAGADTAAVTFDAQAPTGTAQLLQDTVSFTASRDQGGATYDGASPTYDLSSALAAMSPSAQGYHVKVSVAVNGGNPKHKVFWVSPCPAPAAAAAAAVGPTKSAPAPAMAAAPLSAENEATLRPAAASPVSSATPAAAVDTGILEAGSTGGTVPAATGAVVLGESITRPAAAPDVSAAEASRSSGLPLTGFEAVLWSLVGVVLVAAGFVLHRSGRLRPHHAGSAR